MGQYLSSLKRQQVLADLLVQHREEGKAINTLLSDVFGYVSFACWLFVLLPQLWLNYKRKSSDGLSLGFILMWLAGDFADWYGAYLGRLLLPAILIALYFVITDVVLLAQMFCYRKSDEDIFGIGQLPEGAERPPLLVRRGRRACRFSGPDNVQKRMEEYLEAERETLLDRGLLSERDTTPEDSSSLATEYGAVGTTSREQQGGRMVHSRTMVVSRVLTSIRRIGTAKSGRAIAISVLVLASLIGIGVGSRIVLSFYPQNVTDIISQVFGYISAAMFFVAYIPQIAWNFTAQSTEGLSAGMFVFTVLGNVTYCLSILSISTEREHLVAYAPWLAGAAGTLGFETLVLWQCYFYSKGREGGRSESDPDTAGGISTSGWQSSGSDADDGDDEIDNTSMLSRSRRRRQQRRRLLRRHRNSIDVARSINNGGGRNGKSPLSAVVSSSLQI
ncbi:hypothetical protein GGI25_006370 [Coemansia spiralis]|uniref:PQ-loop-domain-containing protein n=2 Tax=Coemansia TaxID=4863 RepID=A0A9W8FX11_9FUNG|nr:PQ loop repeat-domain-containing protein [Coemansia spiralis]KAJ1987395.1 hypothetical protein EDC05_005853 [Coemansia umbellata]KAJ2621931.1 hypothetical protein GGI26_003635 [Coemansia sp. RSA 1358]KAJ2668722.1 hypothetical protein GGI25_006370 [Coemansia spiralis]